MSEACPVCGTEVVVVSSRGGTTHHYDPVVAVADLRVLLAWEMGELSEGQAAVQLKMDRVSAREFKREQARLALTADA